MGLTAEQIHWAQLNLKPGLFIVKWIDWWVPTAAPIEWELVSVEYTQH